MRAREQTVESQSILTDSCSLCKVYVCIREEEDRKLYYVCKSCLGSVYAASVCLYVRAQQQQQYAIHHRTDKISPLTGFKITNSIFNVLDNLVVIIHCKIIQSHRSCATKSIQYSYKTDCINRGITSCRKQVLWLIHGCKENIISSPRKQFMYPVCTFMAGAYVLSVQQ